MWWTGCDLPSGYCAVVVVAIEVVAVVVVVAAHVEKTVTTL